MRIRSARHLLFSKQPEGLIGLHVLTSSRFACSIDLLSFLEMIEDWTDVEEVPTYLPATPRDEVPDAINSLLAVDAIVAEGSELAHAENDFCARWKWGAATAALHFGIEDRAYLSVEQASTVQQQRLSHEPQPPLFLEDKSHSRIALPAQLGDGGLIDLMARRRTVRTATSDPLSVGDVAACLYAGLGITGFTENAAGRLPLAMTPSGGARNPYEGFVYARSVDGLAPGFYHYAAIDHSITPLDSALSPDISALIAGQDWADSMPCAIILCAWLDRSMWKYEDAGAYRVVLIEAGHIGQNIMLAATARGLTACPTAALSQSLIRRALGLSDPITQAPTYVLTLGVPAALDS